MISRRPWSPGHFRRFNTLVITPIVSCRGDVPLNLLEEAICPPSNFAGRTEMAKKYPHTFSLNPARSGSEHKVPLDSYPAILDLFPVPKDTKSINQWPRVNTDRILGSKVNNFAAGGYLQTSTQKYKPTFKTLNIKNKTK